MAGRVHDERRHLGDAEHQHDQYKNAGPRYACQEQAHADDDRLDESHADDTLRHGTDGRRGQFRELLALPVPNSRRRWHDSRARPPPEGHEDAGDDEGGQEQQQTAANAGHEGEGRLAMSPILGCMLRTSAGGRRVPATTAHAPSGDDGPTRDGLGRGRNLERVVLNVVYQLVNRVAQRAHEDGGRDNDQQDPQQDQQGRGAALPSPDPCRNELLRRIERNRKMIAHIISVRNGAKIWKQSIARPRMSRHGSGRPGGSSRLGARLRSDACRWDSCIAPLDTQNRADLQASRVLRRIEPRVTGADERTSPKNQGSDGRSCSGAAQLQSALRAGTLSTQVQNETGEAFASPVTSVTGLRRRSERRITAFLPLS
jgi:hypothetical protein